MNAEAGRRRAWVEGGQTEMKVGRELEPLQLELLGAGQRFHPRGTAGEIGAHLRADDDAIAGARPEQNHHRGHGRKSACHDSLGSSGHAL